MTHSDTMKLESAEASPSTADAAHHSRLPIADVVLVRWIGWLLPVALFAYFFDLAMLDFTRVFPLMRGDWALYIAAPSFVRDSPWLSFPIGRLPGYMAPVGTWLGQTDSFPILYPVYRVLSIAMPHRPFQLIGWELLGSMMATFGIVRRYLRSEALSVASDALRAELIATAGAVILLTQPYYLVRAGHPALFQMWVIPWALVVTSRILDQRREGESQLSVVAFLAPIGAATALNPYLALMVLPSMCIPIVVTARNHLRDSAIRLGGAVAVFLIGSFALGYMGTGGRSRSEGFGLYMADAALLVDGGNLSRIWPNTPPNLTYEGFGFPGTPLLIIALSAAATLGFRRVRGQGSEKGPWLWPMWLGVGLTLVWAMLPVIRVFDRAVLDLNDELSPFDDLTAAVRSNGRLAWPFLWAVGLFGVRWLARQRRAVAHLALAAAAVLQVADAVPSTIPQAEDRYGPAMAIVRDAVATGIRRVEFQPPNVWTDCPAEEWGPFENIAQLATAAAVEGLAVNSGYPARGNDEFHRRICEDQRESYLAGNLEHDVLYVIPPGTDPISAELVCRPTDLAATVCRLPQPTAVEGTDP